MRSCERDQPAFLTRLHLPATPRPSSLECSPIERLLPGAFCGGRRWRSRMRGEQMRRVIRYTSSELPENVAHAQMQCWLQRPLIRLRHLLPHKKRGGEGARLKGVAESVRSMAAVARAGDGEIEINPHFSHACTFPPHLVPPLWSALPSSAFSPALFAGGEGGEAG